MIYLHLYCNYINVLYNNEQWKFVGFYPSINKPGKYEYLLNHVNKGQTVAFRNEFTPIFRQLEDITEEEMIDVCNLSLSCFQLEIIHIGYPEKDWYYNIHKTIFIAEVKMDKEYFLIQLDTETGQVIQGTFYNKDLIDNIPDNQEKIPILFIEKGFLLPSLFPKKEYIIKNKHGELFKQ